MQLVAFLSWGAGMWAAVALAARAPPPDRAIARGLTVAALVLAGGGAIAAALFTTQTVAGELPPGTARTLTGRLHDLATLGIFAGLVLAAVASLRLVRSNRYRGLVALLALALLAVVPTLVALGLDAHGIGQRGFILVGCLWLLALVRLTPAGTAADAGPRPRARTRRL